MRARTRARSCALDGERFCLLLTLHRSTRSVAPCLTKLIAKLIGQSTPSSQRAPPAESFPSDLHGLLDAKSAGEISARSARRRRQRRVLHPGILSPPRYLGELFLQAASPR